MLEVGKLEQYSYTNDTAIALGLLLENVTFKI